MSSDTLDSIIERAFLDVYDPRDCARGLAIVITDGIEPPFSATVVGQEVEVVDTTTREGDLMPLPAVICERDGQRYTVDVLDLENWQDAEGAEYIAAYRKHYGLEPWGKRDELDDVDGE